MIAGYILAGGQNRRMGGKKKLFLEYGRETFCHRILRSFQVFPTTYLSVENRSFYEKLGIPLVVDAYPQAGPLGGICTGLSVCPEEALFVVACDMPLVDTATVKLMVKAYEKTSGIVVARSEGRIHPLLGIYPKTVRPVLEELINSGRLRMIDALAAAGYQEIMLPVGSTAAENINTPEEYQVLLKSEHNRRTDQEDGGKGDLYAGA